MNALQSQIFREAATALGLGSPNKLRGELLKKLDPRRPEQSITLQTTDGITFRFKYDRNTKGNWRPILSRDDIERLNAAPKETSTANSGTYIFRRYEPIHRDLLREIANSNENITVSGIDRGTEIRETGRPSWMGSRDIIIGKNAFSVDWGSVTITIPETAQNNNKYEELETISPGNKNNILSELLKRKISRDTNIIIKQEKDDEIFEEFHAQLSSLRNSNHFMLDNKIIDSTEGKIRIFIELPAEEPGQSSKDSRVQGSSNYTTEETKIGTIYKLAPDASTIAQDVLKHIMRSNSPIKVSQTGTRAFDGEEFVKKRNERPSTISNQFISFDNPHEVFRPNGLEIFVPYENDTGSYEILGSITSGSIPGRLRTAIDQLPEGTELIAKQVHNQDDWTEGNEFSAEEANGTIGNLKIETDRVKLGGKVFGRNRGKVTLIKVKDPSKFLAGQFCPGQSKLTLEGNKIFTSQAGQLIHPEILKEIYSTNLPIKVSDQSSESPKVITGRPTHYSPTYIQINGTKFDPSEQSLAIAVPEEKETKQAFYQVEQNGNFDLNRLRDKFENNKALTFKQKVMSRPVSYRETTVNDSLNISDDGYGSFSINEMHFNPKDGPIEVFEA